MSRYLDATAQLAAAQKPNRGAPPYSRWVNRPLGRRFAALAHVTGLQPDQVTGLSALCTFGAILVVALVPPHWWIGFPVAGLLVLGYGLDAADGQLARLRGGGSLRGEWLDHVVDATKICLLHSAVLISVFRFGDLPAWYLLVPLGYQLVASVFFFTFILMEKLRTGAARAAHRTAADSSVGDLVQTLVALPTDYGVLCCAFVLFGWTRVFAVAYLVLAVAGGVVLLAALTRWWRELGRIDRER